MWGSRSDVNLHHPQTAMAGNTSGLGPQSIFIFVYLFILFKLWIKTIKILFGSITPELLGLLEGGYAGSNMNIFHFKLIDLDLWNAFCEVSSWGSFLFTLQRQKKVCTLGDEAVMKIHKKLFLLYHLIHTFCYISRTTKNLTEAEILDFAIRKIWAFIWYQKYTTSGWTLGDENVICIRAFKF